MMYRNKTDLVSREGIEVDAGSLWQKNNQGDLVLVDDDQYASHELDNSFIGITETI